jgi:hypothetical protein
MKLRRIAVIVLAFFSAFLVVNIMDISAASNDKIPAKANEQSISLGKILGLSAISSFSPGIALLSVSYNVEKERNKHGENNWLVGWLWLFWIIAFIDVMLDKFPVLANVNQFVEHGLIWYVAYVAVTALGADMSMIFGALTGSGVQAVRQTYHGAAAFGSVGTATPVISTIEDVVTGIAMYAMM